MKRRPPTLALAVLVLLLVGGLGWWWRQSRSEQTPADVAHGSVESTTYQVYAAGAGRVSEVLVAEGDTVEADKEVVTLDAAGPTLQLEQAQAGVTAAQAAVNAADDGTDAEQDEARARLTQARASVGLAQLQVDNTTVKAPHAGTVTAVLTTVGQNASPGASLLTLQDDTDLYARVFVPQPQLGTVTVGGRVRVSGDGVKPTDGTVTWVSPTAEFTPNTVQTTDERTKLVYAVKVQIEDTSGVYKAGMPVDVTF